MNLKVKVYLIFAVLEGVLSILLISLLVFALILNISLEEKIIQFFWVTIPLLMILMIPLTILIMRKYFPSVYEEEIANRLKIRSLERHKKIGALIGIVISSFSAVSFFTYEYLLIFIDSKYLLENKDLVETILLGLMVFGIVFSGFFLTEKKKTS